jgi:ribonucleoside-diphosphate reductase alpha chain
MEKAKRNKQESGITERVQTGCGNMYIILNKREDKLFEVFGTLGKAGGCTACFVEGITRCISLGLRHGIPASEYAKQLENISCPSPALEAGTKILSCLDAISKTIKENTKCQSEVGK